MIHGFHSHRRQTCVIVIIYPQLFIQSTERSHRQKDSEDAHRPSFLLRDVVWAPGNIPSSFLLKTQSRLNTK